MAAENATDERQFAYGFNQYKACECPAVSAGYDPCKTESLALKQVADSFDKRAQEQTGTKAGVIGEETAKSVWLDLLERYEGGSMKYREHARIAQAIATELGWIEE